MKKILVTGRNSFIGTSFEQWIKKQPDKYEIVSIDVKGNNWKSFNFSSFEVVFHVAGIAHASNNPKLDEIYYAINRDLALEVAQKARLDGVKQFIFMSSIIIFDNCEIINNTITSISVPNPKNTYGISKLQAEIGLRKLENSQFKVAIIRPPMIYGPGAKGNYRKLAKLIQYVPFFPNICNERSMLFIDHLCEFLKIIIDENAFGIFHPQNSSYVCTSELVKTIAMYKKYRIKLIRFLNPILLVFIKTNLIHKLFGSLKYSKELSEYKIDMYNLYDFKETIYRTEIGSR